MQVFRQIEPTWPAPSRGLSAAQDQVIRANLLDRLPQTYAVPKLSSFRKPDPGEQSIVGPHRYGVLDYVRSFSPTHADHCYFSFVFVFESACRLNGSFIVHTDHGGPREEESLVSSRGQS